MLILVLALVGTLILYYFIKNRNRYENCPPGPIRWPIVGSIPQIAWINFTFAHLAIVEFSKKYGGIFSLGFGVHYAVFITSLELMKELFTHPAAMAERYEFPFVPEWTMNKNTGLIWNKGEIWWKIRKFTVYGLHEFGFGKSNSMGETMREEIERLVEEVKIEIEKTGGIWEVDKNRIANISVNILWSSVGGSMFELGSSFIRRHMEVNHNLLKIIGTQNLISVFPFLRQFGMKKEFEKHKSLQREAQLFMKEIIDKARSKWNERVDPEPHTFIEVFLEQIEKDKGNPKSDFTEEQLIVVLMDLFLGGTDTSSTLINWIILYLTIHENVQEKVRAEISKSTTNINSVNISQFPYFRATILESMRLCPFFPISSPRCPTENIQCGDYVIPQGTCLFFSLYPVFHDKTFWGDEDVFRPERFFDESGIKFDAEKLDRMQLFGFGKRQCPGEILGVDMLYTVVSTLLSHFSLHVVEGREPSMEPDHPSITISPQPYCVKVKLLT